MTLVLKNIFKELYRQLFGYFKAIRLITIPSCSINMLKYRLLAFLGQCDISDPYPKLREPIPWFKPIGHDSKTNALIPPSFEYLEGKFVKIQFKGFLKQWEAIEYLIS